MGPGQVTRAEIRRDVVADVAGAPHTMRRDVRELPGNRPNSRDSRTSDPPGGVARAVLLRGGRCSALPVPDWYREQRRESEMSATRKPIVSRLLVLAASTAAFVLGTSIVVVAQTAAPTPAASKSAPAVPKKHTRGGAAEEQNEMSRHFQKMTQRLKLTDDQVAKVKPIMQAQWAESNELRAKYKGRPATPENKAALEKAREDLHASSEAKLAQVLSADQMTEFKKMRAEHMKKEGTEKDEKEEAK
jgi:Spy/CpxP family protein refolding chaperone